MAASFYKSLGGSNLTRLSTFPPGPMRIPHIPGVVDDNCQDGIIFRIADDLEVKLDDMIGP